MQEEIQQQVIALSTSTIKFTARTLHKLLTSLLRQIQKKAATPKKGKQTVKQLARQNAGMQNIEITDDNIKSFERVARKYGVDFALKHDKTQFPPRWLVFFKARDADALTAALKEFTGKMDKRQELPSLRERLHKLVEQERDMVRERVRGKEKEGPEL